DVRKSTSHPVSALLDINISVVMDGSFRVGVQHVICRREYRHDSRIAIYAALAIVNCTLDASDGGHFFVINVDVQGVAAHEVVVLPGAAVARVNCQPGIVMKLALVADDIDRTLGFGKWSGPVGLFLAVVSRSRLAATVGDLV